MTTHTSHRDDAHRHTITPDDSVVGACSCIVQRSCFYPLNPDRRLMSEGLTLNLSVPCRRFAPWMRWPTRPCAGVCPLAARVGDARGASSGGRLWAYAE